MKNQAFHLHDPAQLRSCAVFASPHSGRNYGPDFRRETVLGELALRSSEDAFVDHLFSDVTGFGAPFLCATAPRAFLDLNRSPEELDPAVIEGAPKSRLNPRVSAGLGVIPRVVANGRAIYSGKIPMVQAQHRINTIWHPYHRQLQDLLNRAKTRFGQSVLIDCHSMPREAVLAAVCANGKRPDIVLGDRFGAAAAPHIIEHVEAAFRNQGFNVARNSPFAGAYTAQHYGRPARQQHVIQVEVDRSIYMDEQQLRPLTAYTAVRKALSAALQQIAALSLPGQAVAAE